jgi:hypothetical protein
MGRRIEIWFRKRNVRAVAVLLEDLAPRTCEAVWKSLPQEGDTYHAKYASNEVYTLVPPLAENPGPENTTIYPIPGDVCYFYFPTGYPVPKDAREMQQTHGAIVDLAIFYDRNNLLLSPASGYVPGNVFATITEGLPKLAEACESIWREGSIGERLAFHRVE